MAKIITTDRVLEFARTQFVAGVSDLLDDPTFISGDGETRRRFFAEQRVLARDLDLDFDDLVSHSGSAYERERLRSVERGDQ